MKRFLLVVLISALTLQFASAQQKPQYTQYVLNNMLEILETDNNKAARAARIPRRRVN